MVEEMELLFTKEGMKVRKRVSMPFTGEGWHEELVSYEEIARRDGIKLTVGKIEPEIEKGVLKGLKFQVTDYSTSPTRDIKVKGWGAPLKVDSKLRNKIIGVQHEDKTAIHTGF
jgi:hypothetical protein